MKVAMHVGPYSTSGWKERIGLATLEVGKYVLHIGIPDPEDWVWGRATDEYGQCLEYLGLGPFLLAVWM